MHKKRRTKTKSQNNSLKNYALKTVTGSVAGLVTFFILALAASFVLWKNDTDTSSFKYVIFVIAALAGFVGGFVAVRPVRKNGIVFGALSALLPCIVVAVVSMLISKSGLAVTAWIFFVIYILLAAAGGIVAANKRK